MILYAKLAANHPGRCGANIESIVLNLKNNQKMIVEWDSSGWSYDDDSMLLTAKGAHEWDGENENYLNNMLPYIQEQLVSVEQPFGFDQDGNAFDVKLLELEFNDNGNVWSLNIA